MAFIWNIEPNPPSTDLPIPVPPGEVTYEVKLVANTVDYGGTVRYNTTNRSYDVVYEFPTLNVIDGVFENGFFESANVNVAHINVATIGQASINTANITNATIQFGYTTGDPTTNSGIATKQYVDNAVAAISGGTGPDSTANLFITTGDLLVGFAPNTAHRLANGSDGQVLSVVGSSNLKVAWVDTAASQRAAGVFIGTHHHPSKKRSQILLKRADGIIMNDGEYVPAWSNLIADMAVSGAGGLDPVSVEAPNSWYEVYAIRKSSTGERALLLHRMLNRLDDAKWPATSAAFAYLRRGETLLTIPALRYCTKVSQSFVSGRTGKIASIDLKVTKVSAPTGNMWVTIQGDNGLGNADDSILCTSSRFAVQDLSTSETQVRFVFDTAATLTTGSRYHVVAEGDFGNALADTAHSIGLTGNTSPLGPGQQGWMANVGYTSGNLTLGSGYGDCRVWNVVTSTWKVAANATGVGAGPQDLWFTLRMVENDTSLVLPSGYDQYCLISYCCNNNSSDLKEYQQHNRTLTMGYDPDWLTFTSASIGIQPLDLALGIPPISCSLQLVIRDTYTGFSGEVPIAHRFSFDLPFGTAAPDNLPRGQYYYGQTRNRVGYTAIIPMDQWNYIHIRPLQVGSLTVYAASFTF
jgi:hypothetical protein